jgi:hypothetical protein
MRGAAKKSTGRRVIPAGLPVTLATIGFLVTFTVRSWDQGRWRPGQAADYGIAGASQQSATARRTALETAAVKPPQPLESVLRQEAIRLRARAMPVRPAAPPAIAPAAAIYLAERSREETHNGRLR